LSYFATESVSGETCLFLPPTLQSITEGKMALLIISQNAVSLWAIRLVLALLIFVGLQSNGFSQVQVDERTRYANLIAADGRPEYAGRGLDKLYWVLINKGYPPQVAYRGTYVYDGGYILGYQHGLVLGATGQLPPGAHEQDVNLQNFYKTQQWSQDIWGLYQYGYFDGRERGKQEGASKRVVTGGTQRVPMNAQDFGRYSRGVRGQQDPNDPWSDLRFTNPITGPGVR
jgi:hypothetical protein